MTIRLRHIPALAASLAMFCGGVAHAQSAAVTEAVNARLLVGTFGRICAAPDATADGIEAHAANRRWGTMPTGSLGDPAISAQADMAWQDSFGGGDGRNVSFMLFIKRDGDGNLENCGVRYQGMDREAMATALEASALFKLPANSEADDVYCVATYPMAGRAHEIRLTEVADGLKDGHLTMTRSADVYAKSQCPIVIGTRVERGPFAPPPPKEETEARLQEDLEQDLTELN